MPKSELADIDGWRENQADRPTRPEAIRRLVKQGLGPRASADPLHISTKVPPFTVDEDVA